MVTFWKTHHHHILMEIPSSWPRNNDFFTISFWKKKQKLFIFSWFWMVWGPGTNFFEFSMKNPIQNNPQISISWITFFQKIIFFVFLKIVFCYVCYFKSVLHASKLRGVLARWPSTSVLAGQSRGEVFPRGFRIVPGQYSQTFFSTNFFY